MNDFSRLKNCIPKIGRILLVNLISSAVLVGFLMLLRMISGLLLSVIDRPAFTSGDLPHLLRSWQGIAVTIVGVAVLFIYVAVDLNVSIILSKEIVDNQRIALSDTIKQAFVNLKLLVCPFGVLIILFISFVLPLVGGFFGISLTSSFRIPDFILTVIHSKPIFYVGYWLVLLAGLVVEIKHIFTMHYINLAHKKPKEALKAARELFRKNRKEFFSRMVPFTLLILSCITAALLLFVVTPIAALGRVSISKGIYRFLLLLIVEVGEVIAYLCAVLLKTAFSIELTALFEEMQGGNAQIEDWHVNTVPVKRGMIAAAAVIIVAAIVSTANFDRLFPAFADESRIIAHRGAGDLSNENTVESIDIAYEVDADVCEIDIHRTKDGEYILNHDADFSRLTGDPRTPQEMTLAEIKQLRMNDGSQIATLGEILDAAKDRVHLYIELKGVTADRQMVDDVYKKLVEKDMIDQCSMISLNYKVIEYAETAYPEVDTVYLLFFGFGHLEQLKCDSLGLEQETATLENIQIAHEAGKRVDVWTCNSFLDLLSAIRSDADGVITDKPHLLSLIKLGEAVVDSDFLRIMNSVLPII